MKRPLTIVVTVVIALIGIQGYRIIEGAGLLYAIEPHFSGQCQAVSGVIGAEDITIDHGDQYAYISADDRRAMLANTPGKGGIYGLDLSTANAVPVLLTEAFSEDFHPHGISLYQNTNGEKSLFVINHLRNGANQIEIFDINSNRLIHRKTISYPELIAPNDLVAVGPAQFYVTNDHGSPFGSTMQTIEDYLGLPLSNITYFDGTEGSVVATGLRYGNGIAVTPDLKTLYVAETTGRKINVYDRDLNTGSLTRRSEFAVNSGADNLEWDETGQLWLAGHPRLLEFVEHAKDATKRSPSQAIKIDINTEQPTLSEIYLSAGEDISGSSVAAVTGSTMLIGSVFEDRILRCELK